MATDLVRSPILSLPTELAVSLFRKLDSRSLLLCEQVCRSWNSIIKNTVELQYRIELGSHNVRDSCPRDMTTDERLRLLKAGQMAWRTLDVEKLVPITRLSPISLYNAVFTGDIVAHVDFIERKYVLKKLYADEAYAEEVIWAAAIPEDTSITFSLMAMDVDQGLLAAAFVTNVDGQEGGIRILLREIETCNVHPGTTLPGQLELVLDGRFYLQAGHFQIRHDFIVLNVTKVSPVACSNLIAWNWRTGQLQFNIDDNDCPPATFRVVGQRYGLFSTSISIEEGQVQGFCLLDITRQPSCQLGLNDAFWECALLFPQALLEQPNSIIPSTVGIYTSDSLHRSSSLFPPCQDTDSLILISISDWLGPRRRMLVLASKLIAKVQERKAEAGSPRRIIPWDEWKDCVIWISSAHQSRSMFMLLQPIAGLRYVESCTREPSPTDRAWTVRILDFNPRRVARALSEGLCPGESIQYSSSMQAKSDEELITRYPYLIKEVQIPRDSTRSPYAAAFFTEDGLFLVDTEDDGDPESQAWTISAVRFREAQVHT